MNNNKFDSISISGRYIYAYLCLLNAIKEQKLEPLPDELEDLIHEFVSSNLLDVWHGKVENILPSFILDDDNHENKHLSLKIVIKIKGYYIRQPAFLVSIIDDLFWLGISNLYSSYKSEISFSYVIGIIETMNKEKISLPSFNKIENCSVEERKGWGELTDMQKYI